MDKTTTTSTTTTMNEMTFELELFEQLIIECNVHANPSNDVTFQWEFNSSSSLPTADDIVEQHSDSIDNSFDITNDNLEEEQRPLMNIKTMEIPNHHSIMYFMPRSIKHFGTIYCYGENRIGRQQRPCIYHIHKSGSLLLL